VLKVVVFDPTYGQEAN
jgi:hypothetical protein